MRADEGIGIFRRGNGLSQQPIRGNLKHACDARQYRDGGVAQTSFHARDISPINLGCISQSFLAQLLSLPKAPHIATNDFADVVHAATTRNCRLSVYGL